MRRRGRGARGQVTHPVHCALALLAAAEQDAGSAAREQIGPLRGPCRGVQGDDHRAGRQGSEHGEHCLQGRVREQGDAIARCDAEGDEAGRQRAAALFHARPRERAPGPTNAPEQGDPIAELGGAVLQEGGEVVRRSVRRPVSHGR
jgi:hypothetical protein